MRRALRLLTLQTAAFAALVCACLASPAEAQFPWLWHGGAGGVLANDFDGTNDYLTRGANLDGVSDGDAGTLSFWAKIDGGDGANRRVMSTNTASATAGFDVRLGSNNLWIVVGRSSLDVNTLAFTSLNAYTAGATWHHVLASWDASAGLASLYVDGASDYDTDTDTVLPGSLDYTEGEWSVGAFTDGTAKWNGCLTEVYFTTDHLDITDSAVRAKFRDSNGRPVELGATCQLPSGAQPALCLRSVSTTNTGGGGGMTVNGALTLCDSKP